MTPQHRAALEDAAAQRAEDERNRTGEPPEDFMRVRITALVFEHLDGSSLYQRTSDAPLHWYSGQDDEAQRAADGLRAKLDEAPTRKDGSMTVDLDEAEVDVLRSYVEGMEMGGRDNAWDASGLAEYNSARALLNKIGRRPR